MKKTSNLLFVIGLLLAALLWSSALWLYGCGKVIEQSTAQAAAPSIVSVLPISGATGVVLNSTVVATLNNDVAPSAATAANFTLTSAAGAAIAGTVTATATSIKFVPTANLSANTTYVATLAATVASTSGKALGTAYTWSFTTGAVADTTAPTITAVSPASGAVSIAVTSPITATFDKDIDPSTITTATFTLASTTQAVTGTVSYDATNKKAIFVPAVNLGNSLTYVATISATVKDSSGNALGTDTTWSFTTVAATGGGGGATDCNTVILPEVLGTGGMACRISLVSPTKCQQVSFPIVFEWTTSGTYCETPYTLYITDDPTMNRFFYRKLSEDVSSGITKTGGGFTTITAANLAVAGVPATGTYYWAVAGYYGSHPANGSFIVK